MKEFPQNEAIKFGFESAKSNLAFFIPLLLIVFIIDNLSGATSSSLKNNPVASFILLLIFWLISMIVELGLIKISLNFVDKKKPSFSDLFSESSLVLRFIGATFLYVVIVLAGLILFIIPGVIWALQFGYYKYAIVDKNAGVLESLQISSKATKGNRWNIFKLNLLFLLINLLGIAVIFIGLFISIPTTMLASAYVYRKLVKN